MTEDSTLRHNHIELRLNLNGVPISVRTEAPDHLQALCHGKLSLASILERPVSQLRWKLAGEIAERQGPPMHRVDLTRVNIKYEEESHG